MSTGIRHFIFEDDGTFKRLSQRVHDGVYFSGRLLPQYAGAKVRIATVFILITNGVLDRVRHIDAEIWRFDEAGAMKPETYGPGHPIHRMPRDPVAAPAADQAVVNVADEIAARRWDRENRWTPTDADVTRMVNVIWPKLAGRAVLAPPLIESPDKRRPPMTAKANHAISYCWRPAIEITEKLDELDNKDLKAFIAKAHERADPADFTGTALWTGIIAAAEKTLAIKKARQSPKGTWFASIEKETDFPGPDGFIKIDTVEYRECQGREAAVQAARELLAKHAHLFDTSIEIRASLCPAIEWVSPDAISGPGLS